MSENKRDYLSSAQKQELRENAQRAILMLKIGELTQTQMNAIESYIEVLRGSEDVS